MKYLSFADMAKLEGLTVTGLLKALIIDYISGKKRKLKEKIKTIMERVCI